MRLKRLKYWHTNSTHFYQEGNIMKKYLAIIISLAIAACLMISGLSFSFAADGAGTEEPAYTETYPLFDKTDTKQTGYWQHPFIPDEEMLIEFDLPVAVIGVEFFASCCSQYDVELLMTITDLNDEIVWQGSHICNGDKLQSQMFDKTVPPGSYTLSFKNVANPEYPEGGTDMWFVLGSGAIREDYEVDDILVSGTRNSGDSLGAPWLEFYVDSNYVTPEPTATPEPTPTPEVTEAPEITEAPEVTDAPEATEAPEEATKEPTGDTEKKGCGSVIVSGIALIAVAASAIIAKKRR